jgi:long-chain acyl-CoA synthetase
VRPTVLISVPRIYERVFGKLQESLAGSALKLRLFQATQVVGWRRFCKVQQVTLADGEGSAWPLHWDWMPRPTPA